MPAPLVAILESAIGRPVVAGRPTKAVSRSVMSGKLAERAGDRWADAKLEPIGLHESRHTYASLLVAAHYTLKEVMIYPGHADLTTTSRYVKRLPQPAKATRPTG